MARCSPAPGKAAAAGSQPDPRNTPWEQHASGQALVSEARERATRSPESARLLLELAEGQPESITGPMVTMGRYRRRPGRPRILQGRRHLNRSWHGRPGRDPGPASVQHRRGRVRGRELLAGPAWETFQAKLTARGHRPTAAHRVAQLGQDAGLIGAADLARL
jgi:glucokinase